MANMKLVTTNDRSYPDSAKDRSVRAVGADEPVVEQWARGGLVHCLTQVTATPHLVAVHALEATTKLVIGQLRPIDRLEKMSKLFHFLNQSLGANAKKGWCLDLSPLVELVAGNGKETMEGEVAASIDKINV